MLFVGSGDIASLLRTYGGVFPSAQLIEQITWPHRFVGNAQITQHLPGDTFLIASIINRELRWIPQFSRMTLENAYAGRVERPNLRAGRFFLGATFSIQTEFGSNTMLHFGGRFIGERNSQNPVRLNAILDQLTDSNSNNTSFPRTRPG
jgi:hypothetical protein